MLAYDEITGKRDYREQESKALNLYIVSNQRVNLFALVIGFGSEDSLDVLEEYGIEWGFDDVVVRSVQRNVSGPEAVVHVGDLHAKRQFRDHGNRKRARRKCAH